MSPSRVARPQWSTLRWAGIGSAIALAAASTLLTGPSAGAAIVATVPLATSANYSVLGGSTVTNTGPSILANSLGLSPGPSITGFPPGNVLPPGTTDTTNAGGGAGPGRPHCRLHQRHEPTDRRHHDR